MQIFKMWYSNFYTKRTIRSFNTFALSVHLFIISISNTAIVSPSIRSALVSYT